jgi:hypothetical protein
MEGALDITLQVYQATEIVEKDTRSAEKSDPAEKMSS